MRLTADQLIYVMEIAAKNADAYGMKPIELFSAMKDMIEEEIADGETYGQGAQETSEQ